MNEEKYYKNPPEADEGEPLFDVSYSPEEGDLVVFRSRPHGQERKRRSILRRLGIETGGITTDGFASDDRVMGASRAYHTVRRYAVRHDLRAHATLKYDDQVAARWCRRDLSGAMKRIRKQVGRFPYVAVHEQGDVTNQLHWHALLPFDLDDYCIKQAWEAGDAFITRAATFDELEKRISYVTKSFKNEADERFFATRYAKARGFDARRLKDEGLTSDDVDILVQLLAGDNYDTLVVEEAPNPFVVATYRWTPLHVPRGN
jgi:hypothetical protein